MFLASQVQPKLFDIPTENPGILSNCDLFDGSKPTDVHFNYFTDKGGRASTSFPFSNRDIVNEGLLPLPTASVWPYILHLGSCKFEERNLDGEPNYQPRQLHDHEGKVFPCEGDKDHDKAGEICQFAETIMRFTSLSLQATLRLVQEMPDIGSVSGILNNAGSFPVIWEKLEADPVEIRFVRRIIEEQKYNVSRVLFTKREEPIETGTEVLRILPKDSYFNRYILHGESR